jgi:protein translocase SEC61 complex gamma subunit
MIDKIKSTMIEWWRVLRVTKKPTSLEFRTIIKVSGLGMMIIGGLGFLIHMFGYLLNR